MAALWRQIYIFPMVSFTAAGLVYRNMTNRFVYDLEMEKIQYEPTERRPLQSRNTIWAAQGTQILVNWKCSPNAISIFGMIAAILGGFCFFGTGVVDNNLWQRLLWLCGGVLCQVRLLCNLFDGMVAVARNIASKSGELFNEIPDRVSDVAVMIGLGYSITGKLELGYLAAIISVFVAYLRAMAKSLGAPNDYCGPMAKPQRMAVATGLAVYMAIRPTSWQMSCPTTWFSSITATPGVGSEASMALLIICIGGCITAWRRISRANQFLRKSQP